MGPRQARTELLNEIISAKKREVADLQTRLNVSQVKQLLKGLPRTRGFLKPNRFSLIAELKKASPSAGLLIENYQPANLAKAYEEAGAGALSVLTDSPFFQGKIEHLNEAKEATTVPVLRKDFIIDETQIYESRISGADAVLLIVRILTDGQLKSFLKLAKELKLACLVETHSAAEVERALGCGANFIGINNRDLDTLKVDLNTTLKLMGQFPELKNRLVVSESGIGSAADVKKLKESGVSGILVGESILSSRDVSAKIRELLGG
jgi:indole-3-glycerol phosphate synthase